MRRGTIYSPLRDFAYTLWEALWEVSVGVVITLIILSILLELGWLCYAIHIILLWVFA